MKIGIFGGTFDPIHVGHVNVVEEVKFALGLDKIIVVPAFLSPHKTSSTLGADARMKCVSLAVEAYDDVEVTDFEISQGKSIYSYNTLQYFNELYPDDEIIFIIGTDQYENFDKWYKSKDILEIYKVVVVSRNHEDITIQSPFEKVDIPIFDVSSTLIRERMVNNEPFQHLVPHAVYQYLKENH